MRSMKADGNDDPHSLFIESLSGGGAEKVLRDLVNAMDQTKFSVTVQTLYPEDAEKYLAPGIRYKYCYPARSRSNDLRMRAEAALGLTYPLHIKGGYDVEAAYLECGSTKIMAGSTNQKALKLAWVHCDLAKKAADAAKFVRETKEYYKKYDLAVCVSDDVRRSFTEMYGPVVETRTVYNCYDDAGDTPKGGYAGGGDDRTHGGRDRAADRAEGL